MGSALLPRNRTPMPFLTGRVTCRLSSELDSSLRRPGDGTEGEQGEVGGVAEAVREWRGSVAALEQLLPDRWLQARPEHRTEERQRELKNTNGAPAAATPPWPDRGPVGHGVHRTLTIAVG